MRHIPNLSEEFYLLNPKKIENSYSGLPFCEVVADFHEFVTDFAPKKNNGFSKEAIINVMNNYINVLQARFDALREEQDDLLEAYEKARGNYDPTSEEVCPIQKFDIRMSNQNRIDTF